MPRALHWPGGRRRPARGGAAMHARVIRAQARAEGPAEGAQQAADFIRQDASQRPPRKPGFRGGLWLADRESGRVLVLTLREAEQALRAGEPGAEHRRARAAERMGVTVQGVASPEVLAQA